MNLETIQTTFSAWREICDKAKVILLNRLDEHAANILDAKYVEVRGMPCIAVCYLGLAAYTGSAFTDHELIPASWFEDGFNWRKAKWPITEMDTKELARAVFRTDCC